MTFSNSDHNNHHSIILTTVHTTYSSYIVYVSAASATIPTFIEDTLSTVMKRLKVTMASASASRFSKIMPPKKIIFGIFIIAISFLFNFRSMKSFDASSWMSAEDVELISTYPSIVGKVPSLSSSDNNNNDNNDNDNDNDNASVAAADGDHDHDHEHVKQLRGDDKHTVHTEAAASHSNGNDNNGNGNNDNNTIPSVYESKPAVVMNKTTIYKSKELSISATSGRATTTSTTTSTTTTTKENPTASIKKEGEEEEAIPTTFKKYDNVAIVTKIHGPHQWGLLVQSMCLLHFAYNHKVLYDIIVFTADPDIPQDDIDSLEKLVAPAKIQIVVDNKGFQEEIATLTPIQREKFLDRCNVTDPVDLTWWSGCQSENDGFGNANARLAYNWQAEFRSVRIWEHPALEDYKYMLWLDSDGFCTKPWKNDPVEYFIENDGVIMFDHFPRGSTYDKRIIDGILRGFNDTTVCNLKLNKEKGHLERTLINRQEYDEGSKCKGQQSAIKLIHGFMHITNLDWYRQPKVINGLKTLLGDCFLCRVPDDQLAVTIPAAIYAPERSWDMRSKGFHLDVFHNFHLDGQDAMGKDKPKMFVRYWKEIVSKNFTSAANVCPVNQND